VVDTTERHGQRVGQSGSRSGKAFRRVPALLLLALVVVYAPMGMEYTLHFWTPHAPQLWNHTLDRAGGRNFEQGPGSIAVVQAAGYHATRVWLSLHTTMAGTALLLGIGQFSDRLRRARPSLHRRMGTAYVTATFLAMIGSAGFLVNARRGNASVFSGRPFEAGLWGLWAITLLALVASLLFLRAGDYRRHSEFMALSYAGLLTAPFLRVGWVIIARTSSLDQWDANLAYSTSLVPQTVLVAALWRSFRRNARPLCLASDARVMPPMVAAALQFAAWFGAVALCSDFFWQVAAPHYAPPKLFPDLGITGQSGAAFVVYAIGSAVAMVLGARVLGPGLARPARDQLSDPRTVAYLAAVAAGAVGLLALTAIDGDRVVGGIVGDYYWLGVAFFWLLVTGLFLRALLAGRSDRAIEWGVHSLAMTMQSAAFHLIYPGLGLVHWADTTGRVLTAGILSFGGVMTFGFVGVALLGKPHPSIARGGRASARENMSTATGA
jgi:hypothetical protein